MADNKWKKTSFDGYFYQLNRVRDGKRYFRCSKFKLNGCKAKLVTSESSSILSGNHTCEQHLIESNFISSINTLSPSQFIDSFISDEAINLAKYPHQIFQELLITLRSKYTGVVYKIPSKNEIYSKLREIRGSMLLNSIHACTISPARLLSNGQPFFRRYWSGDVHGEYHQIMIWATNESISLMKYNGHTFVDGTFRMAPAPFVQCLIIMVYDIGTDSFVPCAYCLITGKNEHLYCNVFHELIVLTEYSWMPKILTLDFEKGLISAVNHQFPQSKIHGCYFHLKQSLRRKLIKLKIESQKINIILSNVELLTLLPVPEIPTGIEYIKFLTGIGVNNVEMFWTYFERVWMKRYDPKIWNINSSKVSDFAGRTNNCLERYNRRLGDFFNNAHPNLASFALVLKNEFEYYSEKTRAAREDGSGVRFNDHIFQKPIICEIYQTWKAERNIF